MLMSDFQKLGTTTQYIDFFFKIYENKEKAVKSNKKIHF